MTKHFIKYNRYRYDENDKPHLSREEWIDLSVVIQCEFLDGERTIVLMRQGDTMIFSGGFDDEETYIETKARIKHYLGIKEEKG
jgi:hypothetical protein